MSHRRLRPGPVPPAGTETRATLARAFRPPVAQAISRVSTRRRSPGGSQSVERRQKVVSSDGALGTNVLGALDADPTVDEERITVADAGEIVEPMGGQDEGALLAAAKLDGLGQPPRG